jgi:hypothetical protein
MAPWLVTQETPRGDDRKNELINISDDDKAKQSECSHLCEIFLHAAFFELCDKVRRGMQPFNTKVIVYITMVNVVLIKERFQGTKDSLR